MSIKEFAQFASVHCHPASLDSASGSKAFAKREVELGSPALVATDHGTVQAAFQTYELAKKNKLIPVIGLEAYFRDDFCPILEKMGIPRTDSVPHGNSKEDWAREHPQGTFVDYCKYFHCTMHAMDYDAYLCMVRLLSKADLRAERHGSEMKPMFDWAAMEELASHRITATSSCLVGMVQRHLMGQDNAEGAKAYFERMKHLFGDRFYVEVFPHKCTHDYVKKVFVDLVDDSGVKETLRFNWNKRLRTRAGELLAEQLADQDVTRHQSLLAHKHYYKWYDYEVPKTIVEVRKVEDFIENECRPWHPNSDVQEGCNRFVLDLAKSTGAPVVIGDDSHFTTMDLKIVQDVRLAQQGPWKFHGSYHRQSSREAFIHFESTLGTSEPEFEGWVENSHAWAQRFKDFKFESAPSLPTKFYPSDTLAYTRTLIEKHGRMPRDPRYVARLKKEIDLLHRNGTIDLLPYFFLAEETVGVYAQAGELTGPGRGSAAGLLLSYLLGITHVDPLRFDLSLDRFLTLDRIKSGKLPDVDIDFPHRLLLVGDDSPGSTGWLHKRFGDHFAQISVDTTLKLRNAVLDVSRARYGYVPPDVAEKTKKFEIPPQGVDDHKFVLGYTNDEDVWVQGSVERDRALQAYINDYPDDWETVKKCLGLARQKGRHASAFIVANKPISDFIPLTTVGGVRVTAFTAGPVEAVGGLKMDFLVVSALNDIQRALKLVGERHGHPGKDMVLNGRLVPGHRIIKTPNGDFADIWDLPEEKEVCAEVARGNTITVFQFGTPGAQKWLKYFNYERPDDRKLISNISDMAVFTSLDRPGPLDAEIQNPEEPDKKHNMLIEYTRRARGLVGSQDIPDAMAKLFPETYGVMVTQEQLQRAYQSLTGCTGPEAEEFRSNVAKKKKEKVDAALQFFLPRAPEKLGDEKTARHVWDMFVTFGRYGFNFSHAVSYSFIAYATAYLKYHYPLEWWTAVLENAKKEDINDKFWPHCGHLVKLPDITHSKEVWTIEGDRIRAPFSLIHGIGPGAHEQLTKGAPYSSLEDFIEKIRIHREAGATIKEKVKKGTRGRPDRVEKVKSLGRSALHRGIVHTLVISGAMESIFPPGAVPDECMDLYDRAYQKVFGKPKGKVTVYPQLDAVGRYQMRKSAIPAWGSDLRPIVASVGLPDFLKMYDGKRMRMSYADYDRQKKKEIVREDPVVGLERFQSLRDADTVPQGGWRCAVLAYVESASELLYDNKRKLARKLLLDVGGAKFELVHWPRYDGSLPADVLACHPGTVVAVALAKWNVAKDFSIRHLRIVRAPLETKSKKKKEEDDTERSESD